MASLMKLALAFSLAQKQVLIELSMSAIPGKSDAAYLEYDKKMKVCFAQTRALELPELTVRLRQLRAELADAGYPVMEDPPCLLSGDERLVSMSNVDGAPAHVGLVVRL